MVVTPTVTHSYVQIAISSQPRVTNRAAASNKILALFTILFKGTLKYY